MSIGAALVLASPMGAAERIMLVDDFSRAGVSALGTEWQGFTDRVMGGVSTMNAGYEQDGDDRVLRMTGEVSLENNGGFVQVRLPLADRGTFDASGFTGIAVEVRGAPGHYYLHLRTATTRLPWQYYAAPLEAGSDWQRLEIPFAAFSGESTRRELDPARLATLAVVGGNHEFSADISVRRIELYR